MNSPLVTKLPDQPNKKLYTAIPKTATMRQSNRDIGNQYYLYIEHRIHRRMEEYRANRDHIRARQAVNYREVTKDMGKKRYHIHKWTEAALLYLRDSYGNIPARVVAERIGVKLKTVQERARRMGLKGKTGRPPSAKH